MKLFVAGICGTFMAGIAQLARHSGHQVRGCDSNAYPPMSTILDDKGISVLPGYDPTHLDFGQDQVIIGNALSRGNALVEAVLNRRIPYVSGPQWLHDNFLLKRKVIAVAGTHGKTTTSSMLAWMLYDNQSEPGFLIGGKPGNFDNTAQCGSGDYFVLEADEYDSAFFDKRSKFVHYCPSIVVLNNLEFDHGDIFDDLEQIKRQFHHLLRIVPGNGTVVVNRDDTNLASVLDMGCWSTKIEISLHEQNCDWFARKTQADGSEFEVYQNGRKITKVAWSCLGDHNIYNALAAIAGAWAANVSPDSACKSLETFVPARRRLERLYSDEHTFLYEDFAHHPTAIAMTIDALRRHHGQSKITAILELRSNTMKSGVHGQRLGEALNQADTTLIYQPDALTWAPENLTTRGKLEVCHTVENIIQHIKLRQNENHVIICMSNGSFDNLPNILGEHLGSALVESTS